MVCEWIETLYMVVSDSESEWIKILYGSKWQQYRQSHLEKLEECICDAGYIWVINNSIIFNYINI